MSRSIKQVISIILTAALILPISWLAPHAHHASANNAVTYYEDFVSGTGQATHAGATLTHVTSKVFDNNADGSSLYVSDRSADWHGVDFRFADVGMSNGSTYTVTASVYVDDNEPIPTDAKLVFQTVDSYGNWADVNFEAGKTVTLTKEFTVDTSNDRAFRIKSNNEGATVPFYIADILVTEKNVAPEPPRPPAQPFNTITFEDGTAGGFTGRAGTETITVTNEANHTEGGSLALKVEGRASTWHGPTVNIATYVDLGHEYKISAWVKLIDPASSQLQLSTQVGSGSSANYVALSSKTINASDGWVLFEGTYRYNSSGNEFLTIYVESSNNATASFYIDDISIVETGSGPIAIDKNLLPIKDAYQNNFLIGNAITAEDLEGVRLELLKMHHNVATAGNAMKPDALQPTQGNFSFTAADEMVNKVLSEGMQMHGHVLVWHQQSPAWMNTTTDQAGNAVPLSRAEALDNLRTHIQTIVEHFGDRVISWDVVNEAMSDNPPNPSNWEDSLRKSPWYQAIGPDYLEQAFLAAREVVDAKGWDIKLYYNDYNEDNQNKATAIYNMVKEINDRYAETHPGKLLIDGVGMQGHYNINTNPANVRLSLEKFISLGVEVSVTELDITAGSNYTLPENLANAQGHLYAQLFKLYQEHQQHIPRVTFWGLDDGSSWRAENNPLLFNKDLQAKPAYHAVIDPDKFIADHQPEEKNSEKSTALYASPTVDGDVDAAWSAAPEIAINRYQNAWQGANGVAKTLWDDENLYVLVRVSDAQLDKSSANVWEQDSVEVFLDENNAKTTFYQEDDGQYRVNFDNETSFSPPSLVDGFESATRIDGTNYTIEMKIPFKTVTPANNMKIGFDVQINDAKDGARQSVAAWNDTTGNGYQDPSVFGVITLAGKPGAPVDNGGGTPGDGGSTPGNGGSTPGDGSGTPGDGGSTPGYGGSTPGDGGGTPGDGGSTPGDGGGTPGDGGGTPGDGGSTPGDGGGTPSAGSNNSNTGSTSSGSPSGAANNSSTIRPSVKIEGARAISSVSRDDLNKALTQASYANGTRQITIDIPKQNNVNAYEVQLPTQRSQERFEIVMQTANGALRIPSSMLSSLAGDADQATIRIAQASTDGLSAATREQIGNRPVIQISVSTGNNTAAWNNPAAPITVSIPYTPTAQELSRPDQIVVMSIDENGNATAIPNGRYDAATGTIVFQTTTSGTFAATYVDKTFEDLDRVLWAKSSIEALAARNIIQGTSQDSFTPDSSITRAEFTALLVRALGLQGNGTNTVTFTDVPANAYYMSELAIAQQLGIAAGLSDTAFRPQQEISRQEMMVLAVRALKAAGKPVSGSSDLNSFADSQDISSYARDSIAALVNSGLIQGSNNNLAPNASASRAEAAVLTYRIWNH